MRYSLQLLLLMLSIMLAGCSAISISANQNVKSDTWYAVDGYVDGDTFKITVGDTSNTIRMLYIDTPEIKKGNTPVQKYGPEASAFTEKLLKESGEVKLTFDKEIKDRYDRTLAIVELKDGRILNELLLQEGLAKVLIVEPNVKMENVYKQLEQTAKQNKIGLWSSGKETSQAEISVHKTHHMGLVIDVDKRGELVTITNTTSATIDMEGWKLISVRGNQTYTFPEVELPANSKLLVSSGDSHVKDANAILLIWEVDNVWSNNEPDPAELYNENNELVALWEDE
ncbi:thermonuclease family protein [Paenibacillus paeoniae]|uniref:Nuclease-like protein n=1 Tax=Paenibacillus paeoniae TaxID=2292705 RepID=A0A371PJI5_9BACL|nr:thermonuclease family protein [Paenibacillus paeoniae]REK76371.1 nuclease-like protein [Paenibacillus paeoniae]